MYTVFDNGRVLRGENFIDALPVPNILYSLTSPDRLEVGFWEAYPNVALLDRKILATDIGGMEEMSPENNFRLHKLQHVPHLRQSRQYPSDQAFTREFQRYSMRTSRATQHSSALPGADILERQCSYIRQRYQNLNASLRQDNQPHLPEQALANTVSLIMKNDCEDFASVVLKLIEFEAEIFCPPRWITDRRSGDTLNISKEPLLLSDWTIEDLISNGYTTFLDIETARQRVPLLGHILKIKYPTKSSGGRSGVHGICVVAKNSNQIVTLEAHASKILEAPQFHIYDSMEHLLHYWDRYLEDAGSGIQCMFYEAHKSQIRQSSYLSALNIDSFLNWGQTIQKYIARSDNPRELPNALIFGGYAAGASPCIGALFSIDVNSSVNLKRKMEFLLRLYCP